MTYPWPECWWGVQYAPSHEKMQLQTSLLQFTTHLLCQTIKLKQKGLQLEICQTQQQRWKMLLLNWTQLQTFELSVVVVCWLKSSCRFTKSYTWPIMKSTIPPVACGEKQAAQGRQSMTQDMLSHQDYISICYLTRTTSVYAISPGLHQYMLSHQDYISICYLTRTTSVYAISPGLHQYMLSHQDYISKCYLTRTTSVHADLFTPQMHKCSLGSLMCSQKVRCVSVETWLIYHSHIQTLIESFSLESK